MRDFSFDNQENTGAPDIVDPDLVVKEDMVQSPVLDEPVIHDRLNLQERMDQEARSQDGSSLSRIHVVEDDDESNNWPKLVGAAVIAVLVVGGGIYAYESSTTKPAPAKQVAVKTPAPVNNMAASQPVTPPENSAMPAPAPIKSASKAPTPEPVAPVQTVAKLVKPGTGIGPSDDPNIDAPMTFTLDNVPPPQKEVSQIAAAPAPSQTLAAQQPVTAPNMGNSSQPTASVAANPSAGATASTDVSSPAPALRQTQPAVQPPAQ